MVDLIAEDLGTRRDDVVEVAATAETTPERTGCDAADDPADNRDGGVRFLWAAVVLVFLSS